MIGTSVLPVLAHAPEFCVRCVRTYGKGEEPKGVSRANLPLGRVRHLLRPYADRPGNAGNNNNGGPDAKTVQIPVRDEIEVLSVFLFSALFFLGFSTVLNREKKALEVLKGSKRYTLISLD